MRFRMFAYGTALALLGWRPLCAQPACDIQSIRGTWAFSELGWTVPVGSGPSAIASPVTVIGVFSVGYAGKMTGSGTTISGAGIAGTPIPAGEVLDFDFTGTVEITTDCVGLLRYNIQLKGTPAPLSGQFVARFVYSPETGELVSMSIQSPLSKPLWIGRYVRLGRVPAALAWPAASR